MTDPQLSAPIQQPRYGEGLRRLLGLRQAMAPLVELMPDLLPIVTIEPTPFALRYLMGQNSFLNNAEASATVGERGFIRLRNPATSNSLVVIEQLHVGAGASGSIYGRIIQVTTDLANISTNFCAWDGRGPTTPQSVLSWQTINVATALIGERYFLATTDLYQIPGPFLLKPGQAWQMEFTGTNTILRASFRWTERAALPDEL